MLDKLEMESGMLPSKVNLQSDKKRAQKRRQWKNNVRAVCKSFSGAGCCANCCSGGGELAAATNWPPPTQRPQKPIEKWQWFFDKINRNERMIPSK